MYVNRCNIGRVKKWLCVKLVNEAQKLCVWKTVFCATLIVFEVSTLQEFDQIWVVCGTCIENVYVLVYSVVVCIF
jgi:hypothetical protein